MKPCILLSILLGLAQSGILTPKAGAADIAGGVTDTNSQELVRAYLQLQAELHATQLAVEQNRKEARDTAVQNSEALATRLKGIEMALASERARELENIQRTNRVMVIVAGGFASLGVLAMLLMAYFQWRTVHGLAEISATLPAPRGLGPGPAFTALGPGAGQLVAGTQAEQSNLRLLGAMEQLERRIHELEHVAPNGNPNGSGAQAFPKASASDPGEDSATGEAAERISLLLAKGQSMVSLGKTEAALNCFDEVLTLAPKHTEALVKKGAALERLQRFNEAVACYDQAIAADETMTIAHLHKGGLFNRMERFNEALECYEKALRTQEKRGA